MQLPLRGGLPVAVALAVWLAPAAGSAQQAVRTVTLEDAIRLALERDPAAVSAEEAITRARADQLEARGAWFPSFTLNSSYGNSSNERFDQATGRLVSESYTAQAQASYELFGGGRRLTRLRSAGAELEAADAAYRAQRFQTVLATTEAFYTAAAASELVRAAEQRVERARQQLAFARTRLEVGTATRSDVLRAELELGRAELALVEAEAGERDARLRLGRQVGIAGEVEPAGGALPEAAPPRPPVEELVAEAVARSPAVLAAQASHDAARADRLAAYTAYLPSVRATAGYDWFAFQFPPDQRSWSLRIFMSLPVFNGFQREAAVSRAAAEERIAQARARDTALAARVAAEAAARQIDAAERRVAIARRGVELAREDLRVQEERYQIGNATILDLQASQVALTEAEIEWVRARQELGISVARLEAVLGRALER
ncbi:MAG TPA: TolC family protein [Longimicrobiales bacterium]